MNLNVELVVHLVGGVVLGLVLVVVRARRARRRRDDVRLGGTVTCPARLAMGGDQPRRGRLELSGGMATWRDRRGVRHVALDGARVLSAVGGRSAQPDDVVLRLALPWQASARLHLHRDDAATLMAVLEAGEAAPAGRPAVLSGTVRREWWALACLVVAGAWLLGWGWLLVGGESRTATVTGGDGGGLCAVAWTSSDGRPERATVDCADDPAGAVRTVWALATPLRGTAVDAGPAPIVAFVLLPALVVGLPGAVRLGMPGRRPPRLVVPSVPAVPVAADRDLPVLTDDDLFLAPGEQPATVVARLAPHARRQVPEDGWESPRRPGGVRGPLTPARVGRALLGPAGALAVAATAPDGLLGVGGLLVGALWAGWNVRALAGHVRQVHLVHREPARRALGVLTAGDDGRPVALVCDPVGSYVRFLAVPLEAPLPHGTAALATAPGGAALSVRGQLEEGGTVLLEVGGSGTALMPGGQVTVPDEWTLLSLLDSAGALALEAGAVDDEWDDWDGDGVAREDDDPRA